MFGSKKSNEPVDQGDRDQVACTAPELKVLIEQLAERISASDRSNSEALQAIHTQLFALSRQSRTARENIPAQFATTFDRLDDAIADLARKVAGAEPDSMVDAPIAYGLVDESTELDVAAETPELRSAVGEEAPEHQRKDETREDEPREDEVNAEAAPDAAATAAQMVADPDMPWSQDSADALTRIYESTSPDIAPAMLQADADVVTPADLSSGISRAALELSSDEVAKAQDPEVIRQAAVDFDKSWLNDQFNDIAKQLTASLSANEAAELSFSEISERLSALEGRFDAALTDLATRSDVQALQGIETYLADLSQQFDQSREELGRVSLIEREVMTLAERLSEDRIASFEAPQMPDAPQVDFEALARQVAEQLALNPPAPAVANVEIEPVTDEVEQVKVAVKQLFDQQAEGGAETSELLKAMHDAMIRMIDRMDAIEDAQISLVDKIETPQPAAAPMAPYANADAASERLPEPAAPQARVERPTAAAEQPIPRSQEAVSTDIATAEEFADELAGVEPPQPVRPTTDVTRDRPDSSSAGAAQRRADFIASARRAAQRANSSGPTGAGSSAAGKPASRPAARTHEDDEAALDAHAHQLVADNQAGDYDDGPEAAAGGSGNRRLLWVAGLVVALMAAGGGFAYTQLGGNANVARTLVTPETIARESGRAPVAKGNWLEGQGASQAGAQRPAAGGANPAGATERQDQSGGNSQRLVAEGGGTEVSQDRFPLGIAVTSGQRPMSPQQLAKIADGHQKAQLSAGLGRDMPSLPSAPASLIPDAPTTASPIAPSAGTTERAGAMMPPAKIGPASLRTAAANGNPSAEFEVGARFAEGRSVPQDFKQAATWYERAAKQNFALAQYRLATLYERGLGTPVDKTLAKYWYLKAASQGTVKAMHNLAVLTAAQGASGKPDYTAAAAWFKRAAERGLTDSQFNLAILYQNGLGVPKDMASAYKWFLLAARGGDKEARVQERAIAKQISKSDKASVEIETGKWRPQRFEKLANDPSLAGRVWQTQASSS